MAAKTMKVGYRLVRNATSTADKAPYLGVAVPVGSLAYDNILQRMLDIKTISSAALSRVASWSEPVEEEDLALLKFSLLVSFVN